MRFHDDLTVTDIFIADIFPIVTAYFTYLLIKNTNRNKKIKFDLLVYLIKISKFNNP